jgi:hypothetical protein
MKLVAAILTLLLPLGTTAAYAQAPRDHHHGIQNVVVIFQENRSTDKRIWFSRAADRRVSVCEAGLCLSRHP